MAPSRPSLKALLAAVSRSFYLTIRALPPGVRAPVGLAYLLARLSDTVADSAGIPTAERLAALHAWGRALNGDGPVPDFAPLAAGIPNPAERALLARAGELLLVLNHSPLADRCDILETLHEILSGQRLDLARFQATLSESDKCGLKALHTAAELEEYTYRVAGCVGAFWTRLCLRHLPGYLLTEPPEKAGKPGVPSSFPATGQAGITRETLLAWGVAFGQGLQLVNVLRDAPADFALGRCYFPLDELPGHTPRLIRADPSLARPLYRRWVARAREELADGLRYIGAIRPWRIRLACFLPWALGVQTLRAIELHPPLETPWRIKVPRWKVYWSVLLGLLAATGSRGLHRAAKWVD